MSGSRTLSRAAQLVFKDASIWWRVPILSLVQLVPLVGSIFGAGYIMVLMRDATWGIDRGLPRFSEFDEIFKRGLTGFVVSLVWTLPILFIVMVATIFWVVSILPLAMEGMTPQLPWWYTPVIAVPTAFVMPFVYAAWLRAAVYLKVSAGLSLSGLRELVARDKQGFWSVAWLPFAAGLLGSALSTASTLISRVLVGTASSLTLVQYPLSFLVGLITVPITLIVASAYGLWAQGTNPRNWPPLRVEPQVTLSEVRGQTAVGEDVL